MQAKFSRKKAFPGENIGSEEETKEKKKKPKRKKTTTKPGRAGKKKDSAPRSREKSLEIAGPFGGKENRRERERKLCKP